MQPFYGTLNTVVDQENINIQNRKHNAYLTSPKTCYSADLRDKTAGPPST